MNYVPYHMSCIDSEILASESWEQLRTYARVPQAGFDYWHPSLLKASRRSTQVLSSLRHVELGIMSHQDKLDKTKQVPEWKKCKMSK